MSRVRRCSVAPSLFEDASAPTAHQSERKVASRASTSQVDASIPNFCWSRTITAWRREVGGGVVRRRGDGGCGGGGGGGGGGGRGAVSSPPRGRRARRPGGCSDRRSRACTARARSRPPRSRRLPRSRVNSSRASPPPPIGSPPSPSREGLLVEPDRHHELDRRRRRDVPAMVEEGEWVEVKVEVRARWWRWCCAEEVVAVAAAVSARFYRNSVAISSASSVFASATFAITAERSIPRPPRDLRHRRGRRPRRP